MAKRFRYDPDMTPQEAIRKAVDQAGGRKELASMMGVSRQAIERWLATSKVPAERVLSIESFTGVSRKNLRPDLYPV